MTKPKMSYRKISTPHKYNPIEYFSSINKFVKAKMSTISSQDKISDIDIFRDSGMCLNPGTPSSMAFAQNVCSKILSCNIAKFYFHSIIVSHYKYIHIHSYAKLIFNRFRFPRDLRFNVSSIKIFIIPMHKLKL